MKQNDSHALIVLKQLTKAAEQKAKLEVRKEREIIALNDRAQRLPSRLATLNVDILKVIDRYIDKESRHDDVIDQSWRLLRAWGRGDNILIEKLRMSSTVH